MILARSLALLAGCTASLVPAAPPRPAPTAVIPFRTVEGGGHTLAATVDGKPGTFLFDTGWGLSAVTPGFAAAIGCKPWGRITGHRATGERADLQRCNSAKVAVGSTATTLPALGVIDLMRYMPRSRVIYQGALGLDAFDGRAVTVRSAVGELVVENAASLAARLRPRQVREVPVRLVREAGLALTVRMGVPTKAGMAWLELDTGNRGPTLVAEHVAGLFGLRNGVEVAQPFAAPVVPGVDLAGEAYVTDLVMDGVIGKQFLDRFDLTLDLARGRAWVMPVELAASTPTS